MNISKGIAIKIIFLLFCIPVYSASGDVTITGAVTLSSTFESISVRVGFSGDGNSNNNAAIQFRKVGDSNWKSAYTPVIDRRNSISGHINPYAMQVRGSIVGLEAGTAYEVSVTFTDPDGVSGGPALTATVTTIAATPTLSGNILYVDDVATNGNGASATPFNSIASAINAASAGTTLLVRAGTYPAFTISKSGTASGYIAIVGESRDQVFINANSADSIDVNGNYIQLKNLRLRKPGHNGIVIVGVHHVWIENIYLEDLSVSLSYDDAGVLVGNANDIYILNSQILSPTLTARPAANPRYDGPGEGVYVGAGVSSLVIKGNNIDGGFRDCIGNSPEDWGGGALDNSDIAYNTVKNCKDDAIQMEGDDVNLRIYGNDVTANDGYSALALQPNLVGPVYAFRNVLKVTASFGAYALKLDSPGIQFFIHNTMETTCYACDGFAGGGVDQFAYNNIIKTQGNPLYSVSSSGKYNGNLYFPASGGPVVSGWNGGATNFDTVAEFRSATGQEQQGKQGDPLFVDSAKHISSSSPAYNSGIMIANFNTPDSAWPYFGSAPDIGAFEFGGTTSDTTPPTLSNAQPSGTLPSGTTSTTMSVTTNENANCKFSTTANVAYSSMANTFTTTGGTTHSTLLTGLANGNSYTRYVRCQDAAGNANTNDYLIAFYVSNPTFDFSLASGGIKTITQGQSTTNTVTSTLLSGTTQPVSFSSSGFPAGATSSFAPASCSPTCTTTLTINTINSTPSGNYTINVNGIGGGLTRTTNFRLNVNPISINSCSWDFFPRDIPDGKVTLGDVLVVVGDFGKTSASPGFNPRMDFNNNNQIDLFDVLTVVAHFGVC